MRHLDLCEELFGNTAAQDLLAGSIDAMLDSRLLGVGTDISFTDAPSPQVLSNPHDSHSTRVSSEADLGSEDREASEPLAKRRRKGGTIDLAKAIFQFTRDEKE